MGLPIRALSRRLVKASDSSIKPYVRSFTNLEFPNNFQGCVACVYPRTSTGDFRAVAAAFDTHLPSFLNYFFPYAGRIVFDATSGRPELHCFNQGAELVVGEVDVALGSLDWTLSRGSLKKILLPYGEDVPLSVQVLSFACGGFTVVWGSNNLMGDGNTAMRTLMGWTELLRTGTIAGAQHDRRPVLFCPRDPPTYSAEIAETLRPCEHEHKVNALSVADSTVERLYYVEARDIAGLHEMAKLGGGQRLSRVHAFSAYTWKVLAGVVAASTRLSEEEKRCGLLWWVDARHRFSSPELRAATRNYPGFVCAYVHKEEHAAAIIRRPLAEVAAMVREAIQSPDYDAIIQDTVDWVEVHKTGNYLETPTIGLGSPTLAQTMWSSFPTDLDFGFGQASLVMPVEPCPERLASGLLLVAARPGGDGSWIVSAEIWRSLAEALEADQQHILKPLTAEYLAFTASGGKKDQQISRL
ncbi:hypothetical protein ACP70R_018486 [Stipagrostis hirtigluma subsp. patula]